MKIGSGCLVWVILKGKGVQSLEFCPKPKPLSALVGDSEEWLFGPTMVVMRSLVPGRHQAFLGARFLNLQLDDGFRGWAVAENGLASRFGAAFRAHLRLHLGKLRGFS